MEHRKFLQRLDELAAELTHAQAQKADRGAAAYPVTQVRLYVVS